MVRLGESNMDESPHINAIRACDATVEINRLALVRLLMMSERVPLSNGSDRVAKSEAFDALGKEDIVAPNVDDLDRKV